MLSCRLFSAKEVLETLRDFFREKPLIFFGTGMSCALDIRFGMQALREALIIEIQGDTLCGEQVSEWQNVLENLHHGCDLESALNSVNDQNLLHRITGVTGKFISQLDKEYSSKFAEKSSVWPALEMIKRILEGSSSNDPSLHVVTPNYDLLLEYACDSSGLLYTNGFWGCVQKTLDWSAADRALSEKKTISQGRKLVLAYALRRHIRLYKVHGSLNYFFHNNTIIQNDSWMWEPPEGVERVIITPGLSKYLKLQRFRQELLQSADNAIEKASRFLFLGYGFNDNHLDEYIKRKLNTQSCHGLVLTRDSNPRIEALLKDSENLWLVCKMDGDRQGSRVLNRKLSNWIEFPEVDYWDAGVFTQQILGG